MRIALVALACLSLPALAGDLPLRPSAGLLFKQPELMRAGACVMYREGGAGWVLTDPVFYLKGEVLSSGVQTRHLGKCPVVPGKNIAQYSRQEFNRQALAFPCVAADVAERDEQIGMVRLRVSDWETPYAKKAENAGRLYHGMFIERQLEKGLEIELEADLLERCEP